MDISLFEPDDIKNIPTFRAAYSDRTALLMAKLAFRAYNDFDGSEAAFKTFKTDLCTQGFIECSSLIDRDVGTAGYIVEGNDIIVVVFRGTQDELDWKTNVNARFVALQGGTRVHTGFSRRIGLSAKPCSSSSSGPSQRSRVRCISPAIRSGAPLLLMATAELANDDDATVRDCVAACYTFGCPRAG